MALLLLGGCGATMVRPETRVASALQTLAGQAATFKEQRHDLAKARQALVNDIEFNAARLNANTAQRTAVWVLTADKRDAAFKALLAATKTSADAEAAFEQLKQQQAQALASCDTKFALDAGKLADVIKALLTLATPEKLADTVKFYIGFVLETRQKVDEQTQKTADAALAAATSERSAAASSADSETDAAMPKTRGAKP